MRRSFRDPSDTRRGLLVRKPDILAVSWAEFLYRRGKRQWCVARESSTPILGVPPVLLLRGEVEGDRDYGECEEGDQGDADEVQSEAVAHHRSYGDAAGSKDDGVGGRGDGEGEPGKPSVGRIFRRSVSPHGTIGACLKRPRAAGTGFRYERFSWW